MTRRRKQLEYYHIQTSSNRASSSFPARIVQRSERQGLLTLLDASGLAHRYLGAFTTDMDAVIGGKLGSRIYTGLYHGRGSGSSDYTSEY